MRAVIIDDEHSAVESLQAMLKGFCPQVNVVGVAYKVADGIKLVESAKPELVFLDIEMPDGTGFDLLSQVDAVKFQLIFTTAFNEFAIRAFKVNAVDYLLKPIDIDDLISAVEKTEKLLAQNQPKAFDLESLLKMVSKPTSKIAVPTNIGVEYFEVKDIVHIDSDGSYCKIFMIQKSPVMVSKNLKEMEDMLEGKNFFRIHHSHIINMALVTKYNAKDGGYVELSDGTSLQLSRRRKDDFFKAMESFISSK